MLFCCSCEDKGEAINTCVVQGAEEEEAGLPAVASAVERARAAAAKAEEDKSAFRATLEKQAPDQPVGLHLEISSEKVVYVVGLRKGMSPTEAYNKKADAPERITAGDYIVAANGVSGDSKKIIDEVKKSLRLELELRRPVRFSVDVEKPEGERIGLELSHAEHGTSLVVAAVREGSVQAWNLLHPEKEVRQGDRILAINAQTGAAEELLKLLAGSSRVLLDVSRPAGL